MKFDTEELNRIGDVVSERLLERLKPILQQHNKGQEKDFTVETLAKHLDIPTRKI